MKNRRHILFWGMMIVATAIGVFAFTMRSSRAQGAVQPLSLKGVTITAAASDHPESNIENYGIAVMTGDYANSKINWDWQQAGAKDRECIFIKHPWYYTYPSPGQPTWEKRSECDQNLSVGSYGDIGEQTITLGTVQDPAAISFKVPKIPPSYYRADGITRWRVRGGIRLYIDDQGNTYHSIAKNAQGIFDYDGKTGVDLTFTEAAVPAQLAFTGPGAKCGNGICQRSTEDSYLCSADCGQPKTYQAEARFQSHGGSQTIGVIAGNIIQLKNTGSDADTFQITIPVNPENRCGLKLTASPDPGDWSTLPKTLDIQLGVNERKDVSVNCVTKDARPGPLTFSAKTVSLGALAANRPDVPTVVGEDQDTITLEEIVCSDPDNEDAWKISAYNQTNPTAPQEPSIKGTTTGKNTWNTYVDSCKDLSTVWESSCGTQGPIQATVACRYGCLDGRCRNKIEYDVINAEKCGKKFECYNNGVYGRGEYSASGDRCIINGAVENLIKQCTDDQICNATAGTCDARPKAEPLPLPPAQVTPPATTPTPIPALTTCPSGFAWCSTGTNGYCALTCATAPVPTVSAPPISIPDNYPQPLPVPPSRDEYCRQEISNLREELKGYQTWLRDFDRLTRVDGQKMSIAPPPIVQLRKHIEEFETFVKKASSCENLPGILEKIPEKRKAISDMMAASKMDMNFATECRALKDDISRRAADLEKESFHMASKDAGRANMLKDFRGKFLDLQTRLEIMCGAAAGDLSNFRFERQILEDDLRDAYESASREKTDDYIQTQIDALLTLAKDMRAGNGEAPAGIFERIVRATDAAQTAYAEGDKAKALAYLDEGYRLRAMLGEKSRQNDIGSLFEGRYSDEIIDRIVEKVASKLEGQISALVDAQVQAVAARIAEFNMNVDVISQGLANITTLAEERQKAMLTVKENILVRAKEVDTELKKVRLRTRWRKDIELAIALAAAVNWCGSTGDAVHARTTAILAALESRDIVGDDVEQYKNFVSAKAEENKEVCYREHVTPFRDFHMHEWFFQAAVFNAERGYIFGRSDQYGNPTGDFAAGQPTLKIEALAMAMRIFNIPPGDSNAQPGVVPAAENVPAWGIQYINGAVKAGIELDYAKPWNMPITRAEAAELLVAVSKNRIPVPQTVGQADNYRDYAQFRGDRDMLFAIEALTSIGVFKGSDGYFKPAASLARSEFAAVNQRISEFLAAPEELSQ